MESYVVAPICCAGIYSLFRYLRVRHTNKSSVEVERIRAERDIELAKRREQQGPPDGSEK